MAEDESTIAAAIGMIKSLTNDVNEHGKMYGAKLACIERKLDELMKAFPEGGFDGHRIYHEQQIVRASDAHDFRTSVRKGLALWGATGTLLIVFYALVEYVKIKVRG